MSVRTVQFLKSNVRQCFCHSIGGKDGALHAIKFFNRTGVNGRPTNQNNFNFIKYFLLAGF